MSSDVYAGNIMRQGQLQSAEAALVLLHTGQLTDEERSSVQQALSDSCADMTTKELSFQGSALVRLTAGQLGFQRSSSDARLDGICILTCCIGSRLRFAVCSG